MPDPQPSSSRTNLSLGAILLVAIILSYWSISTGIPHTVSTDEPDIMRRSVHMMRSGDFNPRFFDYGGFTMYLHMLVASVRFLSGAMSGSWTSLDQVWEGDFYLWSRCVTAFFNVMTVYVVYRVGLRWSTTIGLTAALVTAVHPYLVRQAHFALTDTPLTFFIAETMLLSLVAAERGRLRWFLLAGLATGLAAATKYNGALALLMPLAVALTSRAVAFRWAAILVACGGAAIGFLAAAPYTVLDLKAFLNAFASLASHFTNYERPLDVASTYVKYIRIGFGFRSPAGNYFGVGLWLGWVGWLLAIAGALVLIVELRRGERRTAALVALVFPLTYFFVLSHQSLKFARYLLPMIPGMCLMVAIGIDVVAARLRRAAALRRWPVAAILVLLTVVPPASQAVAWDFEEQKMKTEEFAARWIQLNLPRGKLIIIDEPRILLRPEFPAQYSPRLLSESLESYRNRGVVYLVTSSQQTDRYFSEPTRYPAEVAGWNRVYASTDLVQVVRPTRDHPSGSIITVLKIRD